MYQWEISHRSRTNLSKQKEIGVHLRVFSPVECHVNDVPEKCKGTKSFGATAMRASNWMKLGPIEMKTGDLVC